MVGPVVDYALTLPEVEPSKIVLQGWSFGGYLAPRAATAEPRLAACISDCGPYDLLDATTARIPGILAHGYEGGSPIARRLLGSALHTVMKNASAGWALRRNLWVHGVDDPRTSCRGRGVQPEGPRAPDLVPDFVCATEGDDLSANAETFADQLVCPHVYVRFTAAEGVTGHCEMSGRSVFHRRAYDWLDGVLAAG